MCRLPIFPSKRWGFGCSPGKDACLYFAEPRTLTFDVNKYPKSSFTVDLSGGVQHHPAQQVCNGSHHHHLHPPLAHDLSGRVSFGQTSVFAPLTLPVTAPEHGFKEENENNAHLICWNPENRPCTPCSQEQRTQGS